MPTSLPYRDSRLGGVLGVESAAVDGRSQAAAWWRAQRVCVTGGTGLIGRRVVQRLIGEGTPQIVVYSRSPEGVPTSAVVSCGDILDQRSLMKALEGCSVVVHLAAAPRRSASGAASDFFDVNERGTACVVDACERQGVRTMIYASTAYVYGAARTLPIAEGQTTSPVDAYAASKLAGERVVAESAQNGRLTAVIARFANVYGSDMGTDTAIGRALQQVARGTLAFRDLTPVRDFLHVDDAVEALIRLGAASTEGCVVVNVSTSEGASIGQLAEMLADAAAAVGLGLVTIQQPTGKPSRDAIRAIVLDNYRLRSLTGWAPKIALREGLRRMVLDLYGHGPVGQ